MFYSVLRRIDRNLLAVDIDIAAGLGIGSEKSSCCLGTSGSHQSGEAQDLALAELEAYILHHLSCVQVFHLQDYRSVIRNHAVSLRIFVNDTAHHHVDDVFLGTL